MRTGPPSGGQGEKNSDKGTTPPSPEEGLAEENLMPSENKMN